MPSTQGYNLFYNRVYNRQVIRVLQIAFKNMPFLTQEGPLLRARRACSRTKKGVFFNHEDRVVELRRVKNGGPPPAPPRTSPGPSEGGESLTCYEKAYDISTCW